MSVNVHEFMRHRMKNPRTRIRQKMISFPFGFMIFVYSQADFESIFLKDGYGKKE